MSERPIRDAEGARKALAFFRVMAFAAGTALFILVVIIIINGGFGRGGLSAAWSPIHGLIYFVYVISIANLGFKVGWSLPRMVLTCSAASSRSCRSWSSAGSGVRWRVGSPVALPCD